jgi:tetratricopeptide (TPR) repeat protein
MKAAVSGLIYLLIAVVPAPAQTTSMVAPPRGISDVTAILDQEKPDPSRTGKMRRDADAEPPAGINGAALTEFLFRRAQARGGLGRVDEAIADLNRSIDIERARGGDAFPKQIELVWQYRLAGETRKALHLVDQMIKNNDPARKGRLFGLHRWGIVLSCWAGDIPQAEANLKRAVALAEASRAWPNVDQYGSFWASMVEDGRARIYQAHGQFSQAEAAFHKAQELKRDAMAKSTAWPNSPTRESFQSDIDYLLAFEGRAKAKQARLAEAEADIRRALLGRLNATGK